MNKVILIGRVGKEPVITDTVAKFSLATDFKKADGEKITEWHSITAFGKLKDTVQKWVTKGARVCVEGRLHTEKYEEKYYTSIVVEKLEIIDFPPKEYEVDSSQKTETPNLLAPVEPFANDDVPF